MKTHCPTCGTALKFSDEKLGKHGKCPRCHRDIVAKIDSAKRVVPPPLPERAVQSPTTRRVFTIMWGAVATVAIAAVTFILHDLITHKTPGAPVAAPAQTLTTSQPAPTSPPPAVVHPQQLVAPPAIAQAATAPPPVVAAKPSVDAPVATHIGIADSRHTASDSPPSDPVPSMSDSGAVGTTATGKPIYEGPRGGLYHYSKSGKKVYEKRRK
jgi:hypothetical protein